MPNKLYAMKAKKRGIAQSDEELKANIEAAEGDFEETNEEKKTISVREIDPEAEKEWKRHIARSKAIKAKKEYDKKKYEELMRERAIKGQ